ncbi:MAG: hypothetical protein ACLT98_11125 [Eggerthellaceae bacterium]
MVFQIFNKLTVAPSGCRPTARREHRIDERYRSRFNSGGTFDIQPRDRDEAGHRESFRTRYESEGSPTTQHPRRYPDVHRVESSARTSAS